MQQRLIKPVAVEFTGCVAYEEPHPKSKGSGHTTPPPYKTTINLGEKHNKLMKNKNMHDAYKRQQTAAVSCTGY